MKDVLFLVSWLWLQLEISTHGLMLKLYFCIFLSLFLLSMPIYNRLVLGLICAKEILIIIENETLSWGTISTICCHFMDIHAASYGPQKFLAQVRLISLYSFRLNRNLYFSCLSRLIRAFSADWWLNLGKSSLICRSGLGQGRWRSSWGTLSTLRTSRSI